MKKSIEILNSIHEVKEEMVELKNAGKLDEAVAKVQEIENLKKELAVEEMAEEEIINKVEVKDMANTEVKNKVEIFNAGVKKALTRKGLTEVENAVLSESTGANGGYLVPVEMVSEINKLKRQFIPLKDYCRVISVSSSTGTMPVETGDDSALTSFDNGAVIGTGDIAFNQVAWKLGNYGKIIPVSNALLADTKVDLMSFIGYKFAKSAVISENAKVFAIMDKATAVNGADYTDLVKALNGLDPAIAMNAKVFCNASSFAWLDSVTDKMGRPMLSIDLSEPTKKLFKGHEIVVVSDAQMPSTNGFAFYIGDLTSMVGFFAEEGLEIASSLEAGFTANSVYVRAVERFDAQELDVQAMTKVVLPTSAPATVKTATGATA